MPAYNEVTPISNIVSASPFHVVTYQEVPISPNPTEKEIYRQGSARVGDGWADLYALTDLGLSKLANAAGIRGVPERIDDRTHPFVCAYRFNGEWVQPDSTVLSFATDYELDLRDYINVNGATIRGARFEQALQSEFDLLVEQHFKKELAGLKGEEKKNKVAILKGQMSEDDKKALEERAEEKALKFIVQMRVHMVSRAQTGAKERFIRKVLGLKSAYTIAELQKPFRIPRSEFRFDKMVEQLGPELSKPLLEAKAAALLGISAQDLAQYKQLAAPQTIHPSHPQAESPVESPVEGVIVAEIPNTVTVTIPSGETPPAPKAPPVVESETVTEMIDIGNGIMKPRHEKIGVKVATGERFKKVILGHKHFLDKDENIVRQHYDRYILKYFGLNSSSNLTWEMFVAMRNNLDGKGDDPKYYKPKAKAEVKQAEPKSLVYRVDSAGLGSYLSVWRQDYNQILGAESQDFIEQVENVLLGIANGHFGTSTPEGLKEIDEAFRSAMKEVPF